MRCSTLAILSILFYTTPYYCVAEISHVYSGIGALFCGGIFLRSHQSVPKAIQKINFLENSISTDILTKIEQINTRDPHVLQEEINKIGNEINDTQLYQKYLQLMQLKQLVSNHLLEPCPETQTERQHMIESAILKKNILIAVKTAASAGFIVLGTLCVAYWDH